VFPDLPGAEVPRASMAQVPNWESLATVTLIGVLEEEFGVPIDPEELPGLTSFERFHDYLKARLES
jgi:acyl carrier protein